jgi:DNA-binding response OmpR family regulator
LAAPIGKILVAEDDADIAYLVKYILEREGHKVVHVRDGRDAEAAIAGEPALLAVLDVMMPFKDGFEILGKIRAHPQWKSVPVIMLTARGLESDIVRALDAGASDYMVKPFQPEELRARVRRLLR